MVEAIRAVFRIILVVLAVLCVVLGAAVGWDTHERVAHPAGAQATLPACQSPQQAQMTAMDAATALPAVAAALQDFNEQPGRRLGHDSV
jgi:hypothetical protein